MPRRISSALPSWVVAAIGTVYATTLDAPLWSVWLSVAMGAGIVLSFAIQLGLQRKEGLVNRLAFTTAGTLAIGAIGVAVAWLLHGIG